MRLSRVAFILSILLASCSVGPDYQKPKVEIHNEWHTNVKIQESSVLLRDIEW